MRPKNLLDGESTRSLGRLRFNPLNHPPTPKAFGPLLGIVICAASLLAPVLTSPLSAYGLAAPVSPAPEAYAIIDADRGVIIESRDLHTPRNAASMVKLATVLTAVTHLDPKVGVPISARAAAEPTMRIGMPAGEVWPLEQMINSALMVSANDASWAIAECSGGSVEGFATQAQRLMARLGARDGKFSDPAGLDDQNSYGGGSFLSPWDLAVIGRNALAVPRIAAATSSREISFTDVSGRPHRYVNHNKTLLNGYEGANGLKTGFTDKAGRTLIASATRGGRTMIAVIFGTYDTAGWAGALLDKGFASDPSLKVDGEKLPPVRIKEAKSKRGVKAACAVGASNPGAVAGVSAATGVTAKKSTSTTSSTSAPRQIASDASASETSIWSTIGAWFAVLIGVLVVLVILRRRAVLRRRRLRAERRKAIARAQRAGSLHVIDAKTPTGQVDPRRTRR
jgi:D-alanyl-D-alanine carboxypeptidase (penicillin-binding protein 5/6)